MRKLISTLWDRIAQSLLGTSMLVHVDDLAAYAAQALPVSQDRSEVRLQAVFIVVVFQLLLAEPMLYVYAVPGAPIVPVSARLGGVWWVMTVFAICFLAVVPHLYYLLFRKEKLHLKWPRKTAAGAAVLAMATWVELGLEALRVEGGGLMAAYFVRAAAVAVVGLIVSYSVNNQQMRERQSKKKEGHAHAATPS